MSEYQRLLDNTDRSLDNAIKKTDETVELGGAVMTELKDQGEKLKHGEEKLDEIDEEISKTKWIILQIRLKFIQNKVLLGLIILFLIILLGILIYIKWLRPLFTKN